MIQLTRLTPKNWHRPPNLCEWNLVLSQRQNLFSFHIVGHISMLIDSSPFVTRPSSMSGSSWHKSQRKAFIWNDTLLDLHESLYYRQNPTLILQIQKPPLIFTIIKLCMLDGTEEKNEIKFLHYIVSFFHFIHFVWLIQIKTVVYLQVNSKIITSNFMISFSIWKFQKNLSSGVPLFCRCRLFVMSPSKQ